MISVGGVVVHSGDYMLVGDDDVAIIPRECPAEVVEAAEAIERKDRGLTEAIDRHEWLEDLPGFRQLLVET